MYFYFNKLTAILGGAIYFQSSGLDGTVCSYSQRAAYNIGTVIMYTLTVTIILSALAAVMTYPLEIPIILREVFHFSFYYLIRLFNCFILSI